MATLGVPVCIVPVCIPGEALGLGKFLDWFSVAKKKNMTAIHALILLLAIAFGIFGWEIGSDFAGSWGGIVGIFVGLIVGFSAIVAFLKTFAGLYPYFPRCHDCERSDAYRCISSDAASSRWECKCGAQYDVSKSEFARLVNGERTRYMIKRRGKWCPSTSNR